MSALRNLVEVVLVVEDVERSLAFYQGTLGLELISPPGMPVKFLRVGPPEPGAVPRQVVLVAASMAGGGGPRPTGRRQVLHHIGFEVAPQDYAAEKERLAAGGFALRGGQHPFMPVEAFYLDDPDGNEVEIATWRGAAG